MRTTRPRTSEGHIGVSEARRARACLPLLRLDVLLDSLRACQGTGASLIPPPPLMPATVWRNNPGQRCVTRSRQTRRPYSGRGRRKVTVRRDVETGEWWATHSTERKKPSGALELIECP